MGVRHGSKRLALMCSYFGSCKANGINPEEWQHDFLEKLPEKKSTDLYRKGK